MIFLFDKFKKLKGTVRNRHTISLLYERERNGLYTVSAEIPLKITDKKTVYNYHKKVKDSDFLGHYDREGRFQLHKIASVDIEDSSIFIKGVHLFFDEAKAGAIIQERRFRQSEIIDGARVAFDTIGWSVVDADVSDTADYIFYNVSPLEARAILVETFDYEFDYWLDFDGKNIRNKQISIKREMGKDSNKRYNYGHNVLNIKVEQDYSEIYTAVIGRGKGEDLGDDAYGRRIEFTDVEWKTPSKPMNKPKGSRVLHDENATQLFGYHEDGKVSPRTKVEIFEDIEEPAKLLRASYNWLRENSVPKAVFSLKVPDGDGLDLGDKVHVIYRDIDLVKHTRVTRVIDDLVSGNRDVEFGDTAYFKTDRRLSGIKSDLKRVGGSMSSRISRLKAEFDKRFDNEVQQWKDDFEQALIDAEAAVEAMRAEMTEEFEAAQKEFEVEFNQSVSDAKKHAEEVADAKSKEVQGNLDSFAGRHEQLVGELQGNIVNINGEIADARADVSGILGRLTGVDGSISGIKGSLTEIEGTLSNTKTQLESQITDARTELEQSISNTRTELENKIDTTEEALNKVGEDLGNAKTDLQKQLDEARAELDGLEVGTRNLIPDSHFYSGDFNGWSTVYGTQIVEDDIYIKTFTTSSGSTRIQRTFTGLESGIYTLTLYGILPMEIAWRTFENADKISEYSSGVSEEYGIHSVTFEVKESKADVIIRGYFEFVPVGDTFKMDWFTLVRGSKHSLDWTPAPEDTEQKITNINQSITNIEGELSSKVEQTEVDALKGTVTAQGTLLSQTADEVSSKAEKSVVDTLTGRVTNAESSVTQNAEEIAKRLTKSVYDEDKKATDAKITQWSNTATETAEGLTRVIGRVSQTEKGVETAQTRIEAEAGRIDGLLSRTSEVEGKVSDAELAIKANADGLALRATKTEVEQAIDGIEVGGRNLFRNGNLSEGLSPWGFNGDVELVKVDGKNAIKLEGNARGFYQRPLHQDDSLFTISFLAKSISGLSYVNAGFLNDSTGKTQGFYVSENWSKYSFTTTEPLSSYAQLFHFYATSQTGNGLYITDIKMEKGTKATDWTPAPEDIDASLSEVTDRVTTAEAELVVQAGEISQKATQTELDRVTGRVSTAETSIIQNATEIARRLVKSDYDSDKKATDAEITKWSNLTTETAEGLEQTISRLSTAEGKVTKAQADIIANADEIALKASQSDLNSVTGRVSSAESELSVQAGQIALRATKKELEGVEGRVTATEASLTVMDSEISSIVGRVSNNETNISSVVQDVNSITSTVATLEGEVSSQGSKIEQTSDIIDSKVWLNDVSNIGANLIPQSANAWERGGLWIENGGETGVSGSMRMVNKLTIKPSTQYTISDNSTYVSAISNINIHQYSSTGAHITYRTIPRGGEATFTTWSNADTIRVSISPREGFSVLPHFIEHLDGRIKVKLEEGSVATPMVNAISQLQQTADSLAFKVAELTNINGENILTQSDISIESDRILIGSQQISSNTLASIISVSPSSIDLITDKMNLTGNLNVKGQIESISTSAVKADFANIFAGTADIQFIVAKHLASDSIQARHLYVSNAMAEKLIANTVMAREIKTLSLDAVEANIGSLRTQILTSNVIKSSHIAGGTALIDKIFSSTAMFERMMAKSAFVSTLNTISLHANSFSSSYPGSNREITMENGRARFRYGSIVIENASGRRTIIDGKVNRSQTMTARMPRFQSSDVVEDGSWYRTSSTAYKTAHEEYFVHEARHIRVAMAVHRWGFSAECDGRMETRSGKISNFISTNGADGAVYGWLKIDMGEPLDRPVSDSLIYQFKSRNSSQAKRMHLGNRFLTDFPDDI